jgi:hypothetical protein
VERFAAKNVKTANINVSSFVIRVPALLAMLMLKELALVEKRVNFLNVERKFFATIFARKP